MTLDTAIKKASEAAALTGKDHFVCKVGMEEFAVRLDDGAETNDSYEVYYIAEACYDSAVIGLAA